MASKWFAYKRYFENLTPVALSLYPQQRERPEHFADQQEIKAVLNALLTALELLFA